eukprot:CAMPEP_0182568470 /NCGR_PEP_ID=MMETSP1324-20130603/9401_1 /TAXON_ID=236786 /ORGANISM="Florenciella sp., Strain RCC1587" /LENGTH=77 /DNA_ID=CAMNT_0024782617 /DNA_START=262 /DNA_END=495 /DNA_ORIENTATION=-
MVATSAMAPFPVSPHASVFTAGSMTSTDRARRLPRCAWVTFCSSMYVFIDGATMNGFRSTCSPYLAVRGASNEASMS